MFYLFKTKKQYLKQKCVFYKIEKYLFFSTLVPLKEYFLSNMLKNISSLQGIFYKAGFKTVRVKNHVL